MLYLTCAAFLDWSRREDIQARTVKGRLSWTGRRYQAGTVSTHTSIVLMLYLTCAAFLDWSRREDIQARTVKGRLSWTGRRYQAGTVRDVQTGSAVYFQKCKEHKAGSSAGCWSSTKIKRRV
ncbi:hypothetical protein F511_31343 [Dorcoceras hygrometricum]|uniref:Uncharacterized protein n=1 Tax=Dorcoceras hygrometricum TaxID=472368 RepID=A0A2Z7D5G1_9LAMI|nr:hypothetical protein F511_31343 [Dorcoceras hygrometricum]